MKFILDTRQDFFDANITVVLQVINETGNNFLLVEKPKLKIDLFCLKHCKSLLKSFTATVIYDISKSLVNLLAVD